MNPPALLEPQLIFQQSANYSTHTQREREREREREDNPLHHRFLDIFYKDKLGWRSKGPGGDAAMTAAAQKALLVLQNAVNQI